MKLKPVQYTLVPVNVLDDLIEQKATEGARRNLAMSHIIRHRDLRPRLEDAIRYIELLEKKLYTLQEVGCPDCGYMVDVEYP